MEVAPSSRASSRTCSLSSGSRFDMSGSCRLSISIGTGYMELIGPYYGIYPMCETKEEKKKQ